MRTIARGLFAACGSALALGCSAILGVTDVPTPDDDGAAVDSGTSDSTTSDSALGNPATGSDGATGCTEGATRCADDTVQTCKSDGTWSAGTACPSTCASGACVLPVARPIAPLSTSSVTTTRPTLRWELPPNQTGARVELCHDRACATVVATIDAAGDHVKLTNELPRGVVFWRLRPQGQPTAAPSATWEFFVGHDSPSDTAFGSTCDVNGDGYADALVDNFVFLGSPTGLVTAKPATTFTSPARNLGDLNGDGFADLYVESTTDGGTAGTLYFGSSSGLPATPSQTLAAPITTSFDRLGDFNGDGYGDIVVSDQPSAQVSVHFGGSAGLDGKPARTFLSFDLNRPDFGERVAGAGDVNGDGLGDILIGTISEGQVALVSGFASGPSARVFGGFRLPPADDSGTSQFGTSLASVGDVDGDGLSDVVLEGDTTHFFLFRTRCAPAPCDAQLLPNPDPGVRKFTGSVHGVGDTDGDGLAEIAISGDISGAEYRIGMVALYSGAPSGESIPSAYLTDSYAVGNFGASFSSPGDIDGDGLPNLVIGATRSPTEIEGTRAGAGIVYVYGYPPGGAWTKNQSLSGDDYGVKGFGGSIH